MPLSRNLGTLTSWNPLGHSRPVTGLLYLIIYVCHCVKGEVLSCPVLNETSRDVGGRVTVVQINTGPSQNTYIHVYERSVLYHLPHVKASVVNVLSVFLTWCTYY